MSAIAALLLAASPCAAAPGAPAAPANLAGMQDVSMRAESGHGGRGARRSPSRSSAHLCELRFGTERHVQHRPESHRGHDTARAGDPVRLGPVFFQTGDAGGVGRDPAVYTVNRRLIVIGPAHPPRSAAREAARRGLGRK